MRIVGPLVMSKSLTVAPEASINAKSEVRLTVFNMSTSIGFFDSSREIPEMNGCVN